MRRLRFGLIALGILTMVIGGSACRGNEEPTLVNMTAACEGIEEANELQRQQMAWEIVRHQRLSVLWDSDQITAEVKRVAKQLE